MKTYKNERINEWSELIWKWLNEKMRKGMRRINLKMNEWMNEAGNERIINEWI